MKVELERARYGGLTDGGRVVPRCVHFGACGGCQYQDTEYGAQVELKAGVLRGLLEEAALAGLPSIQRHFGAPWGYRNRIRLRVAVVDGRVVAGYSRWGTNEFLVVEMCPIAAPVLWRAVEALVRLAGEDAVCRRWLSAATEVELFCDGDEAKLQMSLYLRDAEVARQEPEGFVGLCERVQRAVPELVGAGVEMDGELGRRRRKAWDGAAWGAAGLSYEVAGARYWVSRGGFFQVNRFLVGLLVELVTAGRKGRLAWDLYAGVGLFSRALAEGFEEVIAVEGGESAARDLVGLARGLKAGMLVPVHAATLDFLQARVIQRERPDLIVMDPPRAGVGVEGCGLLGRLKVAELVYVSCDPVTLTRDLKVLVGAGYEVDAVHMVDLFPQTIHLETVVLLHFAG